MQATGRIAFCRRAADIAASSRRRSRRRRLASGRPTVKDEKSTGRSAALTIILGFTLVACVCVTNELKIRTIGRLQLGVSMGGFKKFLLRGNLVDLAVAVVIGVAFNAVIQALIRDLITPIISAIGGKPDFAALTFTVNHSQFFYGAFINALLSFAIIAAVVYFLVVVPATKMLRAVQTGTKRLLSGNAPSA